MGIDTATMALAALFCLALVAIGLVIQTFIKRVPKDQPSLYRKIPQLMTTTERRFFVALSEADGERHWLFTKVRLADLMATHAGLDGSKRQSALNKIKAKHVDFVLCKPETMAPELIIELDDASHKAKSRRQRDAFVDEAAAAAGLPVLHVNARSSYDVIELRSQINAQLQAPGKPVHQDANVTLTGGAAWLRSGHKIKSIPASTQMNAKAVK